jgi:tetratricopeptide (TPR) repeat protein
VSSRLPLFAGLLLLLAVGGGGAWWYVDKSAPTSPETATDDTTGDNADNGDAGATGAAASTLPVPPVPPRIASGDQYDKCMTMLADDPEGAEAIASSMQAAGAGNGAVHCQALAMIAAGDPENGAKLLENLARSSTLDGGARAVVLSQAAEARLIADQGEPALKDASDALEISPGDVDLLVGRANAYDALERLDEALIDLDQALSQDASRGDALILRASIYRRNERLTEARADIDRAIGLDPDDAEALLERGILLEQTGDLDGARRDWTHARDIDPTSDAAELATQNLGLLDAGPVKK